MKKIAIVALTLITGSLATSALEVKIASPLEVTSITSKGGVAQEPPANIPMPKPFVPKQQPAPYDKPSASTFIQPTSTPAVEPVKKSFFSKIIDFFKKLFTRAK